MCLKERPLPYTRILCECTLSARITAVLYCVQHTLSKRSCEIWHRMSSSVRAVNQSINQIQTSHITFCKCRPGERLPSSVCTVSSRWSLEWLRTALQWKSHLHHTHSCFCTSENSLVCGPGHRFKTALTRGRRRRITLGRKKNTCLSAALSPDWKEGSVYCSNL